MDRLDTATWESVTAETAPTDLVGRVIAATDSEGRVIASGVVTEAESNNGTLQLTAQDPEPPAADGPVCEGGRHIPAHPGMPCEEADEWINTMPATFAAVFGGCDIRLTPAP